tara:strand:- start:1544 stop:2320 length:777 start_codon:yes stop_codon:yes gene_type:complete
MINLKKIKFPNSNYPIIIIDNFIPNNICKKIRNAVIKQKKFDDYVMGGRNRINKGSDNFKSFLKKSIYAGELYKKLNKKKSYEKINNIFDKKFQKFPWKFKIINYKFSKTNYGLQKGRTFTKQSKKDKKLNLINLDMDFSASNSGYSREPHRDRNTRIINFLIYLNSIQKKNGGGLEIFSTRKNWGRKVNNFPRFPDKGKVKVINKFQPKIGQTLFFLSSPNSYHGVSKFISKKNKRVFIYGSYSLNKPVTWKFKKKN